MIKLFVMFAVSALFLMKGQFIMAQVPAWGGGSDNYTFDVGFILQYISPRYVIFKQANWKEPFFDPDKRKLVTAPLNSISTRSSSGFGVGFLARLQITNYLELKTIPLVGFTNRILNYTYTNPKDIKQINVSSIVTEVPLLLKLKSDRVVGDFRSYIIGGLKYSIELKKMPDDSEADRLDRVVKNKRSFASYEVGLGIDIYAEYFKCSPEIKISNSFGNILRSEQHPYASPLEKLFLHSVIFSLNFE